MKHKFLTIIALCVTLLCCIVGLTACGGSDVHPHEIVEKEIIEREPTCSSNGLKYIICENCNEVLRTILTEKAPHSYEDVVTPPTCTEQGYTTHTCKNCGHIEVDSYTEPTGHSYVEEFSVDDNYHWKKTTCGHMDAIIKTAHTMGEDEICSICGYDAKTTLALKFVKIDGKEEYALDEITDGTVKTVYIPDTYEGLPVTMINDAVFYQNKNIEKVIMGDNITDIGASTFYGCNNLKILKLSESLTEIKNSVFYKCNSLKNITLPDSVTNIGYKAFRECESLTSITIPNSVKSIGSEAFYECESLTSITIPDSVTSIGNWAFSGCSSLTSITIPDSVTSIGGYAFSGCRSLISVTIPDGVTSIGKDAFNYCPCVKINKGLSYVDQWLIKADSSLTAAVIKDGTVGIGDSAFEYCNSLTSVTIPNSITSIGDHALDSCSSLTKVNYTGTIDNWCEIIFGLFESGPSSPYIKLYINDLLVTEVNITTATKINAYAFWHCSSLTSVTIGNSVTSIGREAFYYCSSLTSITIPDSVTSIGNWAFSGCKNLKTVYIDSAYVVNEYSFVSDFYCATDIYILKGIEFKWGATMNLMSYNRQDGTVLNNGKEYNWYKKQ